MSQLEFKINWPFLLLGFLSVLVVFQKSKFNNTLDLTKEIVTLKGQIITVKRTRSNKTDYRFFTNEHSNTFEIQRGSLSRGKHKTLQGITKGTILIVYLSLEDRQLLLNTTKSVTVRGLYVNNKDILATDEYKSNRQKYHLRLSVLGVFSGLMFLLNGLFALSINTNIIVITLAGTFVVILRYFELLLY